MRNIALGRTAAGVLLAGVLVGGLLLRIWGSSFGLPAYRRYHPDEHALVDRAAEILWTGDWNLHRFNYPPFYSYLQAATYAAYFLWGAAQGFWAVVPSFPLPNYYHVGRLLTALFGTLTVLLVYLAGRRLQGRRLGILSAALLGANYLHVIHSHYATFDVMTGFLVTLTLLFGLLIQEEGEPKWYLLAGLSAGLAGATKYNGALALVIPLVAHILVTPLGEWGWLSGRLILTIGGFGLGFFGGNPFALTNVNEFLNGLAIVLHHYGSTQPGFEGTQNWRWYSRVFLTSADALWVVGGAAGLVGLTLKHWRKGLLLLSFPVVYFVVVSRFVVRFERNMVPILPFLALGGGWLLDTASGWLACRWGQGRHADRSVLQPGLISHGLAALGLLLMLGLPLTASLAFDTTISRPDTREVAGRWVEENIEQGSKIAIEHYAIPFDHTSFSVQDVIRITDHDLDWYQKEGYDVLVVSDGVWELLRSQPDAYKEKLAALDKLVANTTLLAEFIPKAPGMVVAGYPTVAVYHFAPVRIYGMPEAGVNGDDQPPVKD